MNRMKNLIVLILAAVMSLPAAYAQMGKTYLESTLTPQFPGGDPALLDYVQEVMEYPKKALEQGLSGVVIVQVKIDKNGDVKLSRILKSSNEVFNKEAKRIGKKLPKFKPGFREGKPIEGIYTFPVKFTHPDSRQPKNIDSQAQNKSAEFPGGIVELSNFISKNLQYPEEAAKNGIQGVVTVKFRILKDGSITGIEVAQGAEPSLDAEALRLVGMFPKFSPAIVDGEAMESTFTLPITFHLSAPGK